MSARDNTHNGLHVGLIGGLGPAATVAYYQRITKTMADKKCRLELTIVHADSRETVANNLAGRSIEQADIFVDLLYRLKAAGADFASITAIGPHFCYNETKARSPLPLLSAISPLDEFCVAKKYRKIGLLGTARAMKTGLFSQITMTETLFPANAEDVGKAYQDMVVEGYCSDNARQMLIAAGAEMMEAGAEAVALAGTDLLLAFDGRDPGYPVIDALSVHATLLADLAMGHKTLADAGI